MENRKIVTNGKMTADLILNWLVWGFLIGFLFSIILSIIYPILLRTNSLALTGLFSVVMSGFIGLIVWKLSVVSSF